LSIGKGRGIWGFEAFLCWTVSQHTARPALYDDEMTFFIFLKITRCIRDVRRKKTPKKQTPSSQACKRVFNKNALKILKPFFEINFKIF
jgi:hypothetical protein